MFLLSTLIVKYYDQGTVLKETLSTLNDLIREGKINYIGTRYIA